MLVYLVLLLLVFVAGFLIGAVVSTRSLVSRVRKDFATLRQVLTDSATISDGEMTTELTGALRLLDSVAKRWES